LYLLSKEIEANSSLGEIQFENFSLIGSMKKGIKVSTANQFDFRISMINMCISVGLSVQVSGILVRCMLV
jgi:hypothetical protein